MVLIAPRIERLDIIDLVIQVIINTKSIITKTSTTIKSMVRIKFTSKINTQRSTIPNQNTEISMYDIIETKGMLKNGVTINTTVKDLDGNFG